MYLLHAKQKYGTCVGNCVEQYDRNHDLMNTRLASGRELKEIADFVFLQDRVHMLTIVVIFCFFLSKVSESCYFQYM